MQCMSTYVDIVYRGGPEETESSEGEPLAKSDFSKERETLLDYIYENAIYLADLVENIKQRWNSFGLATRLTCIDISKILEETMIVRVVELEDESEDEQENEETFANTVVSEKNIFL